MSRRVVDVSIRSEFKKGFGEVARQLGNLEASLNELVGLQSSINRLTKQFENSNAFRKQANAAKELAASKKQETQAQRQVNALADAGAKIAAKYRTEYDKLGDSLTKVKAAQKAGSISNKAAISAEVGLLKEYIRKTNDLAILQRNMRGDKGRFTSVRFSNDAISQVKAFFPSPQKAVAQVVAQAKSYGSSTVKKVDVGLQARINKMLGIGESTTYSKADRKQITFFYKGLFDEISKREKEFGSQLAASVPVKTVDTSVAKRIEKMLGIGERQALSKTDRSQLTSFYRGLFDEISSREKELANRLALTQKTIAAYRPQTNGIQSIVDRTTGVDRPFDERFEKLKRQYQTLEAREESRASKSPRSGAGGRFVVLTGMAQRASDKIQNMKFGPNPAKSEPAFLRLFNSYNKLGHFLFQLQYSTYTLFGIMGAGFIAKQADEYTILQNQVARTSESIKDLEGNMRDVLDISKQTFVDPTAVGGLYARINAYRNDLGLSQKDVRGVTGAIAGAFAASPGTAEAKSAAQYQLIQAIQSNRLGGDELRSIKEQAPFVADILQREIGKIRGLPTGQSIDLSDRNNPVRTKELIQVFNTPEVQAEIKKTLGNAGRTFGDAMMLAKIRAMELTRGFQESTGLIGSVLKMLISFLGDDVKFAKFIDAIQLATTALLLFATAQGVKIAGSAIGGWAKGAGKGIASTTAKAGAGFADDVLGAAVMGSWGGKSANIFKVIGSALLNIVRVGAGTIRALFGLTGIFAIIATVVAALAMRFNTLLGQMTGGMNIMDILVGLWDKLTNALSIAGAALDKFTGGFFSWLGGLVDTGLKILGKLAANDTEIVKAQLQRQYGGTAIVYGQNSNRATFEGTSLQGKKLKGTAMRNADGSWKTDADGNLAIYNNGQLSGYIKKGGTGGLPTGQQSTLPPPNLSTGNAGRSEINKWAEFVRDTYLQIAEVTEMFGVPDSMKSAQEAFNQTIKRGADVLNVEAFKKDAEGNIIGFKTIAEIIESVPEKSRKILVDLAESLRTSRLKEAIVEFERSINETLGGLSFSARKSRLSTLEGSLLDSRKGILSQFASSAPYYTPEARAAGAQDQVLNAINAGDFTKAEELLKKYFSEDGSKKLAFALSQSDVLIVSEITGQIEKSVKLGNTQLEQQRQIFTYFGRNRELASTLADIENKYVELAGGRLDEYPELIALMKQEVKLAKEKFDLEQAYRANWINGAKEAFAEYLDSVNNVAEETRNAFANAFKGLEDLITNFITTGKLDLNSFFTQILNDVTRLFVRQRIMKPIVDFIAKAFKLDLGKEVAIQAKNVYVNGKPTDTAGQIPSTGGLPGTGDTTAAGQIKSTIDSLLSSVLGPIYTTIKTVFSSIIKVISGMFGGGGAAPGGGGGFFSTVATFFASLFHSGGVAGRTTANRMVNPAMFATAQRYHSGGIAGLRANEVPAILQRGEYVLTPNQYNAMNSNSNSSTFSPTIQVNYTNNGPSGTGGTGSKQDADAIGSIVMAAVNEAIMKYDARSRKPGSPMYIMNK